MCVTVWEEVESQRDEPVVFWASHDQHSVILELNIPSYRLE
jgi:hypothetical protein